VPDSAVHYQLRRFVSNLYTIPTDSEVLRQNLTDCYSCLTGNSAQKLSNRLRNENPFEVLGNFTQRVEIESVLVLPGKSYQVDFIVSTSRPNDTNTRKSRMRGTLTVELLAPPEEDIVANPLGIYIVGFDFAKIGDI